jgi:hypothetical protein
MAKRFMFAGERTTVKRYESGYDILYTQLFGENTQMRRPQVYEVSTELPYNEKAERGRLSVSTQDEHSGNMQTIRAIEPLFKNTSSSDLMRAHFLAVQSIRDGIIPSDLELSAMTNPNYQGHRE